MLALNLKGSFRIGGYAQAAKGSANSARIQEAAAGTFQVWRRKTPPEQPLLGWRKSLS